MRRANSRVVVVSVNGEKSSCGDEGGPAQKHGEGEDRSWAKMRSRESSSAALLGERISQLYDVRGTYEGERGRNRVARTPYPNLPHGGPAAGDQLQDSEAREGEDDGGVQSFPRRVDELLVSL